MTAAYSALAAWYDALTGDVDYRAFADFYEARFAENEKEIHSVLDLACGTGSLTLELAGRGYDMTGVDASCEMLSEAMRKSCECEAGQPLLLCQRMEELDLYGTVDAAVCCLDGMNYLPGSLLPDVFRRLHLFVEPGGLLLFDVLHPERLRSMDGAVLVDETDDVFCIWRGELEADAACLHYGMNIFSRKGKAWQREDEEHCEYLHEDAFLHTALEKAGFCAVQCYTDGPQGDAGRLFYSAIRGN